MFNEVQKMMETLLQFPIGFTIALSGALIPGPLLAYVVAKAGEGGRLSGTFAAAGHVLVELVFLALIAMGLGVILSSIAFQVALGILGGIMLLALGALGIRSSWRGGGEGRVAGGYHPLVGGVLFSTILNPSVPVWWVTVGLATLMEAYVLASTAGVVMWLLGHFTADFAWFSGVSLAVAGGRRFMGTRGYRALLLVCASVMVVIGVYLLLKYVPILARVSTS
jgi:threonine/homoserine/homoserine lactone efflux protein